jgi:Protein of unknown function (DUF3570)
MQLEARVRVSLAAAALALLAGSCGGVRAELVDATASVYTRQDTDETSIWSPRARVAGLVDERATLEAAYMMDAWTSASIDIRTSATPAVHELRHEVEATAGYVFDDATLTGGYRYSTENDYWSHGGVMTLALDLAERNTTLALSLFGALDTVGKEGDPRYERPLDSLGGRLTWTQVLTEQSLMQLSWETTYLSGFQASPYRWVALGSDGVCAGAAPYCVPESAPDARFRHALGANYRHALGARASLGLGYRYYTDSWNLHSHTLEPDFSLRLGKTIELKADYRYYTQDEADFYRPSYTQDADETGYVTRDRKLSPLYSHTLGLAYAQRWDVADDGSALSLALRSAVTTYRYLAYVGLTDVQALELTALLRFEHR